MKRLLARPPKLTLNTSFAEPYGDGRFTQLELINQSELIGETRQHDLAIRQETLEELDRYGAFTPIAFVAADWHGNFYGPRWNVNAMTFRDEASFQRWRRYHFREDGFKRVSALYSPWQLMYLKSALEDRLVHLTLPYVLGRRDRLLRGLKNARPFWRVDRDLWQSLEENWRPVVLLLCWLQNRYLPFVRGRSTMVHVKGRREPVDPVRDEVRTFDAAALIRRLGISVDEIRQTYSQLALIGETRDPIKDWFLVVRGIAAWARQVRRRRAPRATRLRRCRRPPPPPLRPDRPRSSPTRTRFSAGHAAGKSGCSATSGVSSTTAMTSSASLNARSFRRSACTSSSRGRAIRS